MMWAIRGVAVVMLCAFHHASKSQPSAITEFGEQSAMYVGSCLGLEYLKKRHCPSVSAIDYKSCIKSAEELLPQRMRSEFRQAMALNDSEMHGTISPAIDKGYANSVSLLNGDKAAACSNYATSMNTVVYLKIEELKRIAGRIK
jgi:hypothetical protein